VPPERLPEVMRTAGKVLRELRLASNTVMRELTSALDDPYNPPPAMRPRPQQRNPPPPRPPVATAADAGAAIDPAVPEGQK
jgi:Sec-independent protein translocase protein TatA